MNKYVIFDCGFKLSFKVCRLEHKRVRAKMNLVYKQVVKTHVGLYTKVSYITCNCMYMTKNMRILHTWPLRVPRVSRLSCSWCIPYICMVQLTFKFTIALMCLHGPQQI